MTLQQVQERLDSLGSEGLARLREECHNTPTGHTWKTTDSNVPQIYCAHCFCLQGVDCD